MPDPNLFLLGTQKAGTTALAKTLASHPAVFMPAAKETYFHCDDRIFANGDHAYRQRFWSGKASEAATWRLDATPFNLASKLAIDRIAARVPESARFIVVLRDPVKRAHSAWLHQIRLGNEPLSFKDALKAEPERLAAAEETGQRWWRHGYCAVGAYGSQLEHAFSKLGRGRVLVLSSNTIQSYGFRALIAAHLKLDQHGFSTAQKRVNEASMPRSRLLQSAIQSRGPLKSFLRQCLTEETSTRLGKFARRMNLRKILPSPECEEAANLIRVRLSNDDAILRRLGVEDAVYWNPL